MRWEVQLGDVVEVGRLKGPARLLRLADGLVPTWVDRDGWLRATEFERFVGVPVVVGRSRRACC